MKKLISLIASLSLVATMFTSVSAAELANNNPVVTTTVAEMTSEELMEIVGEEIPEGQKAFLVDINVTGLDLSIERYDSTFNGKKGRKGVVIQAGSYNLKDIEGETNVVQIYQLDDGIFPGAGNFQMAMNANSPTEAYPQTADSATTPVTATEAHLNTYIVFTNGEEVSGTIDAKLKVSGATYDTTSKKNLFEGTKSWDTYEDTMVCTVNGESGFTVTFPGASEPDPEPLKDFVIENAKTLTSGYSWDVTINNYDSAATYTATFTAGSETKTNELFFADAEVAEGGSIAFAALLKTTKAAVELALSK